MKPSTAIRWIVSAFLITGAWRETGIFTGIILVLIFLSGEIVVWIAGDELKRIGEAKADEWRRKRQAKRKG